MSVNNRFETNYPEHFYFTPPPEAPVFRPCKEDFENPLDYIERIRPIAANYGICKIIPPIGWQPTFAVDLDKFAFVPRLQKLNELEACTRIKIYFIDTIIKFWKLQGTNLKIPIIDGKLLDLYFLYNLVENEGGFYSVTENDKWLKVTVKLGLIPKYAKAIKKHYENILFPYYLFSQKTIMDLNPRYIKLSPVKEEDLILRYAGEEVKRNFENLQKCSLTNNNGSESLKKNEEIGNKNVEIFKVTDIKVEKENPDEKKTSTIKKIISPKKIRRYSQARKADGKRKRPSTETVKKIKIEPGITPCEDDMLSYQDPLAKYLCLICDGGDQEASMLLCDGCDDSYHTFCLEPPLTGVPKGEWRCPACVAKALYVPNEAYGFVQSPTTYTLKKFGVMADKFKLDYFNSLDVPTNLVEREYWRLLSRIDADVTVEYGADLHSVEHGSGFPSFETAELSNDPETPYYTKSPWNLNNLPVLPSSLLRYIKADISGMKVPWTYVGMIFSTFCWHNEDHWNYSINYLHWGDPKTWYGVPGESAEKFECSMKSVASELFHEHPNLLHQLTTTLNPNILMAQGVPVYRTDQQAGEFVVTFPRAYHSGFNQGYNFAEAVNFAPLDWLPIGRECINYYSLTRRENVFCHDELVCDIALNSDALDPMSALAIYEELVQIIKVEKKFRYSLILWGVKHVQRTLFENYPDDSRQCFLCKTTVYVSCVTCKCKKTHPKISCYRHYHELCHCPALNHIFRYRWTLTQMIQLAGKLKDKCQSMDSFICAFLDNIDNQDFF